VRDADRVPGDAWLSVGLHCRGVLEARLMGRNNGAGTNVACELTRYLASRRPCHPKQPRGGPAAHFTHVGVIGNTPVAISSQAWQRSSRSASIALMPSLRWLTTREGGDLLGTKLQQRLGGILIALIGAAFTYWEWRQAFTTGTYHPKAAMLFPAFATLGIGLLIFPMSKEDLLAKYGVEKPRSPRHYPLGLKFFLGLALIVGALDWALISGTLAL